MQAVTHVANIFRTYSNWSINLTQIHIQHEYCICFVGKCGILLQLLIETLNIIKTFMKQILRHQNFISNLNLRKEY